MKKYAYLNRLEELLAELPQEQRQAALQDVRARFEAAGAEHEEETAAGLGTPEEAAAQILHGEEAPLPRLAGTPHRILLAVLALVVLVVLAMGIGGLAGYRTAGNTASSYTEASA